MLVQLSNKSTFLDLMQQDPFQIKDKLLAGLDGDYNVTNMGMVVEVIGELETFHITKEALEATRLGKHINELRRKSADKTLASRAKSLVKKWRSLLSTSSSESGPPPGGGNNNNIPTATNGNATAHNSKGASPGKLPLKSNLSPGLPIRSNASPALSRRSNLSPGLPPRSNVSPGLPPRANIYPDLPLRSLVSPLASISPRIVAGSNQSPGLPPLDMSHVISSASTIPTSASIIPTGISTIPTSASTISTSASTIPTGLSKPTSPVKGFAPGAPAENSVGSAGHNLATKRSRPEDADVQESEPKRPRPDADNHSITNGGSYSGLEEVPASDKDSNLNRPRKARVTKSLERPDVLNKQMSVVRRSGKVRTTQELVQNLGIESRSGEAASNLIQSVNNLVPDENKTELMNRFFHSQESGQNKVEVTNSQEDVPSTPLATVEDVATVEEVLAQLPPVDFATVWAEWEANKFEDEDVDGLIPVLKPQVEIKKTLVNDLNDGQLEHLGGTKDYQGNFKEWHQLVSRETKDGDLLHILPYTVID